MQVEHVEDEEEEDDEEVDSPETDDALLENVQRAREVCVTHCPSGNHRPRLDLIVFLVFCPPPSLSTQADGRELVYLVGASLKREGEAGRSGEGSSYGIEESLEELGRLADTAGLKVKGRLRCRLGIQGGESASLYKAGRAPRFTGQVRHLLYAPCILLS